MIIIYFPFLQFYNKNFVDAHTALLHNGLFYAMYGTNSRRDGLCCMDMEGNVLWKTKRAPNFDKGSMIYADGLLLATDGADALYLIDPSPEGYKQLAKADLLKSDIATEGRGNWVLLLSSPTTKTASQMVEMGLL